jgi:hypothetical protein
MELRQVKKDSVNDSALLNVNMGSDSDAALRNDGSEASLEPEHDHESDEENRQEIPKKKVLIAIMLNVVGVIMLAVAFYHMNVSKPWVPFMIFGVVVFIPG